MALRIGAAGIVACTLSLLLATQAQAITYNLQELIDNQTAIQVGDKIFSQWGVPFATSIPDPTQLEIETLEDDPLAPGFRFLLNGQFDDPGLNQYSLLVVVSTADQSDRIHGISLIRSDATVLIGGSSVFALAGDLDSALQLGDDVEIILTPITNMDVAFDSTHFDPIDEIVAVMIISANSLTEDQVQFNSFEFRVLQTAIPEPTGALLSLMGLACLACRVVRR